MRLTGRLEPKAWILRLKTGWIRRTSTAFSGPASWAMACLFRRTPNREISAVIARVCCGALLNAGNKESIRVREGG